MAGTGMAGTGEGRTGKARTGEAVTDGTSTGTADIDERRAQVPTFRPAKDADTASAGPGRDEITFGGLLGDTAELRAKWPTIQSLFVDDPHASVAEAADVIAQVAARLEAAMQERQRSLRARWDDQGTDTESLRVTLRLYRTFLWQLIGNRTD